MERTEALVVGAGPVGLLAAREIARKGIRVEVLEEHPNIGEPNHCAGLISVEGLRRLGLDASPDFVKNHVTGSRIYSPNGAVVEIPGKRRRAYVVDRAAFDCHLARLAEEEGATIRTKQRVKDLDIVGSRVEGVRLSGELVKARVVIDAEGAGGALATRAGLGHPTAGRLAGVNTDVSGVDAEPHTVEVWLGRYLAPGLFAWVIPLGDGVARCGLACNTGSPAERLKAFIKRRFGDVKCSPMRGGDVLTGGPIPKTYGDGLIVVGDAAGQTKPTTGGGVVLSGMCAIKAGMVAIEAVKSDDASADFLRRYQRAWRASLGREFSAMLAARRLLNRLSDDRINRLFDAVKGEGLEETLCNLIDRGDMDMQMGVMQMAVRDAALLRVLVKGIGHLAIGELQGIFNV